MNKQDIINLINSHNKNVAAFKLFCDKLDEINGGGFPPDKWFQLWQLAPPFAKHAGELVKMAREGGSNAKYNAQNGEINVYESE